MPQVAATNERIQKLEAATRKLPEAADLVSAGDFPGSLRIPGTNAALKVGGQVRVTLVDSFAAIGSGDRFVTSSIPIRGTATVAEGARLAMTAIPSRFNFDVRSPSSVGDLRAFIEADFAGTSGTLRLRHAFAQWGQLLVGQTWSTFSDPGGRAGQHRLRRAQRHLALPPGPGPVHATARREADAGRVAGEPQARGDGGHRREQAAGRRPQAPLGRRPDGWVRSCGRWGTSRPPWCSASSGPFRRACRQGRLRPAATAWA